MSFLRGIIKSRGTDLRISMLFVFILFLAFSIIARLVFLQIINYDDFTAEAGGQRGFSSVVGAERGKIFLTDRFGTTIQLATNGSEYSVYAVPKDIKDKEDFAKKISEFLEVDYDILLKRVSKKDDPYEPVKSIITEEKKIEVEKLGLPGIGFLEKKGRVYPNGTFASHISGFLSNRRQQGVGQYGIEEFYNKNLTGKPGFISGEKDSFGLNTINQDSQSYSAINGDYIFLTIDPNVQFKIEDELKKAVEKWKAESGSVIVMEPSSGKILGMANYPDFNPNKYSSVENISIFPNKSVSSQYEPGSIFKPITMAIGIDTGVITPETEYDDTGYVSISGYTIRNYDGKAYGIKTMTEVLVKSLNTGTVFAVNKISKEDFSNYVKKFGFGEKTGIDLPSEARGNIRNLNTKRDINFATASFGQGIAVTPIQMITAISVIANNGTLYRPFVVNQILRANGSKEYIQKKEVRRVLSENTAKKVQQMLVSVVEDGFDRAKIPGYFVAGKTGTAQIAKNDGRGYSEEMIHSFIGFAPAYNAKFAVLVKLEKPQDVKYASQSLTPVFREIMSFLLNYYEVTPDY